MPDAHSPSRSVRRLLAGLIVAGLATVAGCGSDDSSGQAIDAGSVPATTARPVPTDAPATTIPPEPETTTTTEATPAAPGPATDAEAAVLAFLRGYLAGVDTSAVAMGEARGTLEASGLRERLDAPQVAMDGEAAMARTGFADPCSLVGDVTLACYAVITGSGERHEMELLVVDPTVTGPDFENASGTWVVHSLTMGDGGGTTAAPAACGDLGFTPQTEDAAWDITATGVDCEAARELVTWVAANHNFYSGPPSLDAPGFSCTMRLEDDTMPAGFYTCSSGPATVEWKKT